MGLLSLLHVLSICAFVRAAEESCQVTEGDAPCHLIEAGSLLQASNLRAEGVVKHSDTLAVEWGGDLFKSLQNGWHDLLANFDVNKIKAQLDGVLDKVKSGTFSADDIQKLGDFATTFTKQLNKSVGQAQEQLETVQKQAKATSQKAKATALSEVTKKVAVIGRAALQVAATITTAIERAQASVLQALEAVKAAKTEEQASKLQKALEAQLQVLTELVNKLKQAMNRESLVSLLEDADSGEDLPGIAAKAQAKASAALTSSHKVLDVAKTYVAFVNTTINEAEATAMLLSNRTADAADKVDVTIDQIANRLIALLQNANKMLKGEYDLTSAKKYVEKSGAQGRATSTTLLSLLCVLIVAFGRQED